MKITPMHLKQQTHRLARLEKVDDRGLELAEHILHERRQFYLRGPVVGELKRVDQALAALAAVREIIR